MTPGHMASAGIGLQTQRRPVFPRLWLIGIAALCIAAVGLALVSQHVFDMQPCPWCVLQRVIYLAIALLCLLGAAAPALVRQIVVQIGTLLAIGGMAAALWQHFGAAASASCSQTFADTVVSHWLKLDAWQPDVFSARASCSEAAVKLLGVSYDLWSLALFASLTALLIRVLQMRHQR